MEANKRAAFFEARGVFNNTDWTVEKANNAIKNGWLHVVQFTPGVLSLAVTAKYDTAWANYSPNDYPLFQ